MLWLSTPSMRLVMSHVFDRIRIEPWYSIGIESTRYAFDSMRIHKGHIRFEAWLKAVDEGKQFGLDDIGSDLDRCKTIALGDRPRTRSKIDHCLKARLLGSHWYS